MRRILICLALALSPAGASAAEPLDGEAGWRDGFAIGTDDGAYLLRLRGYFQPRFELDGEEAPQGDGVYGLGFALRRSRLLLQGHVFDPAFGYVVQVSVTSAPSLLDWYADFDLGAGFDVQAGQFRPPFSRELLESSSGLLLVERSIATLEPGQDVTFLPFKVNSTERDVGVQVGWTSAGGQHRVAAAIQNGDGPGPNVGTDLAYAARAVSAVVSTDAATLELAVSGAGDTVGPYWRLGADALLTTERFLLQAEAVYRVQEALDQRGLGFYVQGGALLLPGPGLGFAARYGQLDQDLDDGVRMHEIAVGPNLRLRGDALKVQANYVLLFETPRTAEPQHVGVVQMTFGFR